MTLFSLLSACAFLLSTISVSAKTINLNWDITFVNNVNPDGRQVRRAVGINGQWPCPTINADVGDRIIINANNKLSDQFASLHWHGIRQKGSNAMDGPPSVTQCDIAPGQSYTYDFIIDQPGTYWYHSHTEGQYPDGLRGPLIVHDPHSPYKNSYDDELILTVADWYHDESSTLLAKYLSPTQNMDASEPIPHSALFNEGKDINFNVQAGKTYFVRLINMAAFSQAYIQFDQHTMTIIEVDGVYTDATLTVDNIYIAVGQRYGVILKPKGANYGASRNYQFQGTLDTTAFDPGALAAAPYLNPNVTGHLVYDSKKAMPTGMALAPAVPLEDFNLVPQDHQPLLPKPDHTITLNLAFNQQNNQNLAQFNNISYVPQGTPSMYTALSTGKDATLPEVYGAYANPFVLKSNEIVEVVVINWDGGRHPMHIHGHSPQLVARGSGNYDPKTAKYPATPMRRDVVQVNPSTEESTGSPSMSTVVPGYMVWRFKADNPGVWLLHCHMEWHVAAGLTATMIESPLELQKQSVPSYAYNNCKAQNIPTTGDANNATSAAPANTCGASTKCGGKPNQGKMRGRSVF